MTQQEREALLEEIATLIEMTDHKHMPPMRLPDYFREEIVKAPGVAIVAAILTCKQMIAADVRALKKKI